VLIRFHVALKSILIRNFKSISELRLRLRPGLNVLVGANATGKTNILEAVNFLYKALVEAAQKAPYRPHLPDYWSPLDVVYGRDPSRILSLGVALDVYWEHIEGYQRVEVYLEAGLRYEPAGDTLYPARYILRVGVGGDYTELQLTEDHVAVLIPEHLLRTAPGMRGIEWTASGRPGVLEARIEWRPPRPLLPVLMGFASAARQHQGDRLYWGVERPLLLEKWYPYVFGAERAEAPEGVEIHGPPLISPWNILVMVLRSVLPRLILLRHPDVDALAEPRVFQGGERLDERARNLAEILLALQGRLGSLPERVGRALEELFPGYRLGVESSFGRVALVGYEDGLRLPPPCLPDGLLKIVAIMTAAELNPVLLLIDEPENSLHARMIEYLVDELNSLRVPVLVATHSPIIIDLVGPERIMITRKTPDKGTVVETIRDREELRRRLAEEGVTLSDYVIYGETYGSAAEGS